MANSVDKIYFQKLAKENPADICRRAVCAYDEATASYKIPVWGEEFIIHTREPRIDRIGKNDQPPHDFFYLFIMYYLLNAGEIESGNEWISEKDIPGDSTFFRGPHEIPTYLISRRYGNSVDEFKKRCEALGGNAIEMADAAYRFDIAPRVSAAVLYWQGDEDFKPEAKILYDRTITKHLSLDVIFALAIEICTRIEKVF